MLLKFGDRFTWKGKSGVVGTTLEQNGRTVAADFERDDGVTERIVLERAHAPRVRRAARAVSQSFEEMADAMFAVVKQYIDLSYERRFEEVTDSLESLLGRHQRQIKDDVEKLSAMLTRLDAYEARLKMLEERKPS
jgi:hypothetical protein